MLPIEVREPRWTGLMEPGPSIGTASCQYRASRLYAVRQTVHRSIYPPLTVSGADATRPAGTQILSPSSPSSQAPGVRRQVHDELSVYGRSVLSALIDRSANATSMRRAARLSAHPAKDRTQGRSKAPQVLLRYRSTIVRCEGTSLPPLAPMRRYPSKGISRAPFGTSVACQQANHGTVLSR
jgi:hypothetical protein